MPEEGRDLILAGAIITILINPLLFAALDVILAQARKSRGGEKADAGDEMPTREPIRPTTLKDHVVLIGHGRVGSFISGGACASARCRSSSSRTTTTWWTI